MSIKLKKQSAGSVPTPGDTHVQLYVGLDGLPRTKDKEGVVQTVLVSSDGSLGGLECWPNLITGSGPIAPGYIYVCDVDEMEGDITLTLEPGVAKQRFGIKVSGGHQPSLIIHLEEPEGQSIERPDPLQLPEVAQRLGAYCEWILDSSGNWRLVSKLLGSNQEF